MAQPDAQPQPDGAMVPATADATPINGADAVVEEVAAEAPAPVAEAESAAAEADTPAAAAAPVDVAEVAAEEPTAEVAASVAEAEAAAEVAAAAPAAVAEVAAEEPTAAAAASVAEAEAAGEVAAAAPAAVAEAAAEEPTAEVAASVAEAEAAGEAAAAAPAAVAEAAAEEPAAEAAASVAEAEAAGEVAAAAPAAVAEAAAEEPTAAASASAAEAEAAGEEAAAAPADAAEAAAAPAAEAAPARPALPFRRGQVVDGVVLTTAPTEVRMDLGDGHEGIIPGRELEGMPREQIEALQPGATIPVYVVNPQDHQGNIRLSVTHAQEELDWRKAEACHKSQEVFQSVIAGYNKGGLIVRFGRVRGFVPQSQFGGERRSASGGTPEERWSGMVNQPIAVKVIEVDRSRNRLILSERAAAREQREVRKERLINELEVGEVRQGRVVSLVDFGAFVDIGGAEGLVHLTEISWQHVTHPRDALKIGAEVRVEVISVDPQRKRIGLSIRRQAADPWDTVAIDYKVGQLVQGLITKMTNFGAFARLVAAPEIEGLIHISELAEQRVTHPREVVSEGETLTLRVVKMDVAERRLGLSLKAVNSAEYLDQDWLS